MSWQKINAPYGLDWVPGYCIDRLGYDDGLDCAQNIFLAVHNSLPSFRGESKFQTWAHSVAFNTMCVFLRKKSGHFIELHDIEKIDERCNVENSFIICDNSRVIFEKVCSLECRYKIVLIAHYILKLKYHEIAKYTGMSLSLVKTNAHRGKKILKNILGDFTF